MIPDPTKLTDEELKKRFPTVAWDKITTEQARAGLAKVYEIFKPRAIALRRQETEVKR